MDGGVDVCLESLKSKTPRCSHGPTLLFERFAAGKLLRFYACSACRDRKDCSFFQLENAKVSKETQEARDLYNKAKGPPYSHEEYQTRCRQVKAASVSKRRFCEDCSLLFLSSDSGDHSNHKTCADLTDDLLMSPSRLLIPLDNKKTNAQYLFSEKAVKFTLSLIQSLGFERVLCVGAPRIHEAIIKKTSQSKSPLSSLLLDLDHRYGQFYGSDKFCRYNMFNHHFFDEERAREVYSDFLCGAFSEKVVMVTDPPFGGLVEVLAETVKVIMKDWKDSHQDAPGELGVMWFFPYFMESRITECLPNFTMTDYKVAYDNHVLFTNTPKGRKQGSPVRLFTNLRPEQIKLPSSEGYRFCELCRRYVSAENIHCYKCDACMSKDGTRYVHCHKCDKCVKPSRVHCDQCGRCELPNHKCGRTVMTGCHICGAVDHKRRQCPHKDSVPADSCEESDDTLKCSNNRKKRKSNEPAHLIAKKRKMISKIIKKKRQRKNKRKVQ